MLILHKPREPWNLDEIDFSLWQAAVEQHALHIINCHLDEHDDQLDGQDKNLIVFNQGHFHRRDMKLLFGP